MSAPRLFALVVAVALFAPVARSADDPEFAGKRLSAWIADLASKEDGTYMTALHAIRGLGPKGLPALPGVLNPRETDHFLTHEWAIMRTVEAFGPEAVPGLFDALADNDRAPRAWLVLFHLRPKHEAMEAEFVRVWDAAKDNPPEYLLRAGELFTQPSAKVADRLVTQLDVKDVSVTFPAARGLAVVGPTHKQAEKAARALFNPAFFRNTRAEELLGVHTRIASKFGTAAIPVFAEQKAANAKSLNTTVCVYMQLPDDPAVAKLVPLLRPFLQKPPKDGLGEPRLPWNFMLPIALEKLEAMGPHAKDAVPEVRDVIVAAATAKMDDRYLGERASRILLACGVKREELPEAFRNVPPKEEQVKALMASAAKITKQPRLENDGTPYQIFRQLLELVPDDPDLPRIWAECRFRMHNGGHIRVSDGLYDSEGLHPVPPKFGLPKGMLEGVRKELKRESLSVDQRLAVAQELVWQDPKDPAAELLTAELTRLTTAPSVPWPLRKAAELLADEFTRLAKVEMTSDFGPEAHNIRGVIAAFQTPAGLPRLVEWLDHDSPRVRAYALTAIVNMGPAAKPALPELKKKLSAKKLSDRFSYAAAVFALAPTDPAPLPVVKEMFDPNNSKAVDRLNSRFLLLFLKKEKTRDPYIPWLEPVRADSALQEAAEIYFRLAPEEAVKAGIFSTAYPTFPRTPDR